MPEDLQRMPPIGADWTLTEQPQQLAVTLSIGIPEHITVRRNIHTGMIEIDDLRIEDLITLRDSISEQIIALQAQQNGFGNIGWESL